MNRFTCNICGQKAERTSTIFLDNKLSAIYPLLVVAVIKSKETSLNVPTCAACDKKVRRENHFNKTGSAWIAAAIFGMIIGLMMIGIEIPSVMAGDISSLYHAPVIGLIFFAPSIFVIWRCYRARKEIMGLLNILGHQQKGRMGAKLY